MKELNNFSNLTKVHSLRLSSTGKGYLYKFTDEEGYYYKTGECIDGVFSDKQCIAEVIASRIGRQLGFNCMDYELATPLIDDVEVTVCRSKSFLNDNEEFVSMAKLLSDSEIRNNNLYSVVINKFPMYKSEIDEMILFDFIINNNDRHLNNFGLIKGSKERFVPLFDNGMSLFATQDSSYVLNKFYIYDKSSTSKPFRTKHYKQVKLLDSVRELPKLNIDKLFQNLDLPNNWKLAITNLLKTRLDYVRKAEWLNDR